MFVTVTEQFHDHEEREYYLDTSKLDESKFVDSEIIKACKKKSSMVKVHINATDWETDARFNGEEPIVSYEACCDEMPKNQKIGRASCRERV